MYCIVHVQFMVNRLFHSLAIQTEYTRHVPTPIQFPMRRPLDKSSPKREQNSTDFAGTGEKEKQSNSAASTKSTTAEDDMQWVNNSRSKSRDSSRKSSRASQEVKCGHIISRFLRMRILKSVFIIGICLVVIYILVSILTGMSGMNSVGMPELEPRGVGLHVPVAEVLQQQVTIRLLFLQSRLISQKQKNNLK